VDAYQLERRPIGIRNVSAATRSFAKILALPTLRVNEHDIADEHARALYEKALLLVRPLRKIMQRP